MIAPPPHATYRSQTLAARPTVDQVGIEERIDRLTKRSIKKESKVHALKLALSMIDLTTLEGADSPGKVRQMCYKAAHLHDALPDVPHVAAVCVYPTLVRLAKEHEGHRHQRRRRRDRFPVRPISRST